MNLLQLAQAVKRESGLSGGGPVSVVTATGDDARIFQWVNWAHRDIALQHESWSFRRGSAIGQTSTMTVLADTASPGFALTDFAQWKPASKAYGPSAYRVSDGQQAETSLTYLPWDEFRKRFVLGEHLAGGLQFWTTNPEGNLMVAPTPDTAHVVRADYIRDVVDMTTDTATPMLPERFHMLIVWRALNEYGGFDAAGEVTMRADRNYTMGMPELRQACLPQPHFAHKALA